MCAEEMVVKHQGVKSGEMKCPQIKHSSYPILTPPLQQVPTRSSELNDGYEKSDS